MYQNNIDFVINNLSVATLILIKKIENQLNEDYNSQNELTINCYLAGGAACNLLYGGRITGDLDFELDKRVHIDSELSFENEELSLFLDMQYNPTLGLIHENYIEDAIPIDFLKKDKNKLKIKPYIFSPIDLIMSKLSRWSDNDKDDVRNIIIAALPNKQELFDKINESLSGYIGEPSRIRWNIAELEEIYDNTLKYYNDYKEEQEQIAFQYDRIIYDREELEPYLDKKIINRYMELKYGEKYKIQTTIRKAFKR